MTGSHSRGLETELPPSPHFCIFCHHKIGTKTGFEVGPSVTLLSPHGFCSTALRKAPSRVVPISLPEKCLLTSPMPDPNRYFSVSLGLTVVFFSFSYPLTMMGTHQGISVPTHLITSSFYLSPFGNSELLILVYS